MKFLKKKHLISIIFFIFIGLSYFIFIKFEEEANKQKSGARGLRSIIEKVLLNVMFEVPSIDNICKVVIDESVILDQGDPLYVFDKVDRAEGE